MRGAGGGLAAFKLENTVATFKIQRYLRYAHLVPALACGLVREFSIPLGGAADEQTALLAFSTSGGALSEVVASLAEGDRVELEWLQIKIEMVRPGVLNHRVGPHAIDAPSARLSPIFTQDTDVEDQKYGMVEQCQKLLKLDASSEEALVKQYPQPELLLPKVEPRLEEERAARKKKSPPSPPPKAAGVEKEALEAKFGKKKKTTRKKKR